MQSNPIERRARQARGGFTLLEMMAVIVIIGILTTFLIVTLGGAKGVAQEQATGARIQMIATAISQYETEFGDYPPSSWKEEWGTPPNSTNLGAEALVIALFGTKWQAGISDDLLVNTDNDESKKPLARFPKASLFELRDEWQNPLAYLHRRDYGRQDVYLLVNQNSPDAQESTLKAHTNSVTGQPWNPSTFQLISAGADGEFGTPDDIGNWAKEPTKD